MGETIRVRLGERVFAVERPFGELPVRGVVSDVACCSEDHVFVLLRRDRYVEPAGPSVVVLDPDGGLVATFGDDILDGHMIELDAEDRVHIVDRDAHQIVICRRDGHRLGTLGTRHAAGEPFSHPCDVAFTAAGEVLVADGYAGSSVHRFAADGTPRARWGEPGRAPGQFRTPHAVWPLADGRIVVADRDNDRLQVFDAEGRLLTVWDDFVRPMDVWDDGRGNLLVSDQVPRLSLLVQDGRLLGRCRPVLNGAHGGATDSRGRIYLAEVNPSRLTRLTPT